jgi:acetyl/propionyl-CoA carboxylase alpha subunit/acetyl-CoA carboxylase carboxyltransferase component
VFGRIAIVNRGEAAMRLIRAARELAAETGSRVETVALHTDVDRGATFVRGADIAYELGEASARPYLDPRALARALAETRPDAAWAGWGFAAEDPGFADVCAGAGVTFVGPSAAAMRKLGDKATAKLLAREAGVPVAPWGRCQAGAPDAAMAAVPGDRHVEVQVIADGHGAAWSLGVRDCSLKRRDQKVVEESASALCAEQVADLKSAAQRLALAAGYQGAATVGFLCRQGDKRFRFLEVSPWLQAAHPVTETTTGFDLVKAQLRIAAGEHLDGEPPAERGHAIEVGLRAEDPERDFAPAPGRIVRLDLPAGTGIRVDTGVSPGDTIPADFDSMIAKITAWGQDRGEALGRLRRALAETRVVVEDGMTNKSFLLELLSQPEVTDASAGLGWIDRERGEGRLVANRHSAVALAAVAIELHEKDEESRRSWLFSTARGGRPQAQPAGRPVRLRLRLRGAAYRLTVARAGARRFRVGIETGGQSRGLDVEIDRFDRHDGRIVVDGTRYRLLSGVPGPVQVTEVDGVAHRVSRDEGGTEPLVAAAPGEAAAAAGPAGLDLPAKPAAVAGGRTAKRRLEDLRGLLLGFDADPEEERRILGGYLAARQAPIAVGKRPAAAELELIEIFADIAALGLGRSDDDGDPRARSNRECFHAYLQGLDPGRDRLPQPFLAALARALRHYGVSGLERTAELESAVFRIFLAQRRAPAAAGLIAALLRAWLLEQPPGEARGEAAALALDRLAATARDRFPAVAGLARSVLFAWFGQPLPRRGLARVYDPCELAGSLGDFTEYDLAEGGALVPAARPKGHNHAAIVTGVVRTPTELHPAGITRVVLLGDPAKSLGALAEPECRRVIAALDLAQRMGVPAEWYALSSGARISMTSGTENMDWAAAALRRIVEFTQGGGEINVVAAGISIGAQSYWNAEATMLMHTKGILVMTPDSAMVVSGKRSVDFSGGVSAEDDCGIGGFDRVMGPNGEAQYLAPSLSAARDLLMSHYDQTYVAPGELAPRRAATTDAVDRDVSGFPHAADGSDFRTVGDIFSAAANPDRKKPFDIRTVMRAVSDQDQPVLERWAAMTEAENVVVQDARLGGWPVCLIGIESRPLPRRGFPPADGPDIYTAGTLFPQSSKKTARAINAASGNRPLVVLANLSGFDGSPESMRELQLEYGAEIGRAIVNFEGPIVFCVISRYHGGAFVVFSKALNPNMTVLALEGSFASVLGGAPAAAVVFAADVSNRTAADPRVTELQTRVAETSGAERAGLTLRLAEVQASVRAEKLGEVAAEFDRIHSIQRAVEVGSVDAVIAVGRLRPCVIEAIESRLGPR